MEERIYVGSGKSTNEYFTNISVCLSDLPKEHIFEYNGKKYIKLAVGKKKEVDKYGKTHFVSVDTWKPEEEVIMEPNAGDIEKSTRPVDMPEDDLPF